ncbi:MAG: putative Kinase/ NEK / Serine/threonine protein kinase [Streblomastix strix]|uniref:non-specific serine/threonine protein kinase n=1 Tax=Streblomastix strix TaxID=222440 RepID=A0A5J4VXP6_9EUKA|nr:MAG: putative Kinase/ NEK / Serine/threonine protein kinase [Streblomastix strix]
MIGKGSSGTAFCVRRKIDGAMYCLKRIPIANLPILDQQHAIQEVFLLSRLQSPFIVHYFDSFADGINLNVVMEFADKGTLGSFIQKHKEQNKQISEDVIWRFFIEIALGLSYIHELHILHRDIKTENIFLAGVNSFVKIGDFGVAKQLQDGTLRSSQNRYSYKKESEQIGNILISLLYK